MSGQFFLSKPGAVLSRSLSSGRTSERALSFFAVSGSTVRSTVQGIANSLSPMPKQPPKERTA